MGRRKARERRAAARRPAEGKQTAPAVEERQAPSQEGDQGPSGGAPQKRWRGHLPWLAGVALIAAAFLVLKMFTVNPYAGDEHIYIYQAKLVTEGIAPYSGFAMAHPPLQTLFTALVLKTAGYSFVLGRMLPILWCLAGGLALAFVVRRDLGRVASLAAMGLFVLSYEPLRASSHYTGVNMTVALLVGAVLAYRYQKIPLTAALCTAAVFTRLYAAPGVLVLVGWALLADRRQGLKLVAWGAATGTVAFVATGLWAGFGDMIHNMVLYHAQKTPMKPGSLENMRNAVLFHNATLAGLFVLSWPAVIAGVSRAYSRAAGDAPPFSRLAAAVRDSGLALVLFSAAVALFMLAVLTSMDRVWMYYFIPAFPFAAVAGGWLVSRWAHGALALIRSRGALAAAGIPGRRLAGGLALLVAFAVFSLWSPALEARLAYYQREIDKPAAERTKTYNWNPGHLPGVLSDMVESTIWQAERTIGEPYSSYAYYLWHESRVLDIVDEVVETVERETGEDGEIFGDSGTVPLFALLTGRRIAADEVDTNIQRYRSGSADPEELIERIDVPSTEMIILRPNFGVGGLPQVKRLVERRYERIKVLRSAQGRVFLLYKRRAGGGA